MGRRPWTQVQIQTSGIWLWLILPNPSFQAWHLKASRFPYLISRGLLTHLPDKSLSCDTAKISWYQCDLFSSDKNFRIFILPRHHHPGESIPCRMLLCVINSDSLHLSRAFVTQTRHPLYIRRRCAFLARSASGMPLTPQPQRVLLVAALKQATFPYFRRFREAVPRLWPER